MNNCNCVAKTKIFLCGMVMGVAVGGVVVGLSKKAQNAIKKGKQFIVKKISEMKQADNESNDD